MTHRYLHDYITPPLLDVRYTSRYMQNRYEINISSWGDSVNVD
jgi:hypothetical protein